MSLKTLLFSQAEKLISIGKTRVIQAEDRLPLIAEVDPKKIPWDESTIDWSDKKKFLISLLKASRRNFGQAVFFQVVGSAFSFSTPFLVHAFVSRLQAGQFETADIQQLCLIAVSFGLFGACNGIAIQHYFYQTLKFNQIATNLVNKKIFTHSLKLSAKGKHQYQVGDIVNFMSSDSDAIADGSITTIDMSNAAILSIGCTITLFYFLGWSALVAVVILGILVPITSKLSKSFMHLEDEMMAHRDRRMTLMTQLLNAIRVVKYFVWEKSVLQEVSAVRAQEIEARTRLAQAEITWGLIYTSINSIVLFGALLTHVLRGQTVDMALIFTCISIFGIMEDQFGGLSRFISRFINIIVSADRITKFLKSDTIEESALRVQPSNYALSLQNVSFYYDEAKKIFSNLSLNLSEGQSLAVVGPVGAGKSTLLNLLLNEIQPRSGHVYFNRADLRRAFVPQDAYIVNSTLRENIIFGQKNVTEERVKRALRLSALEFDLMAWPSGLDTEIGEKGVNLSGGQKQRVSLARAILAEADLVLLDDPLSAVDPNTENYLCENLLFDAWKNKTRIVVTHRLASVSRFDQILFLEEGQHFLGTYQELMQSCAAFRRFVTTYESNLEIEKKSGLQTSQNQSTSEVTGDSSRIIQDEDRAIGAVESSIYLNYLKALGGKPPHQKKIIALLFIAAIAVVSAPLAQKLWLSQSNKIPDLQPLKMILVYGGLGLLTMIVTFASNTFWSRRGISAGRAFHDQMLKSILSAPIRFFDSTPVGRILQRFSRDVESVDIYLQWSFDNTIHSIFHITVSFLLIVLVLPLIVVVILPVMLVYYTIQNSYRRVAREVKRLDSLARSPRYAHFKETLNGLTVIRAFGQTEWSMQQFYSKLTYSTEMSRTHYMVNRWFSTRLPLIGAAISSTTCLLIVFSSSRGYIAAGTAGLVTLYALDLWRHLNWGVRIFSDLESRMTSVERLQFYCDLPAERNYIGAQALDVEESWPQNGELEFKNVSLRYADHLPMVLKNVSFKIQSGKRVGLIGRTGSGKSTIFQSVYRFVDIVSGEILLNGQSIHHIPLRRVRKSLAVIPQDPALFMGTLRSNIDRYNQVGDDEIWQALQKVSLAEFVRRLPGQLEFAVAENGANLSQGQRQLICLARALLMKVKIIFLDEATASVDVETDAIVQKVIRESLGDMTLITIAHRLSTLDGYDQIIELSYGEVVQNTLQNQI